MQGIACSSIKMCSYVVDDTEVVLAVMVVCQLASQHQSVTFI